MMKIHTAIMNSGNTMRYFLLLTLAFFCLSPLYGIERSPIDINLIIDGSQAFTEAKEEITAWVCGRLDTIVADGDRVTIWSAGAVSRVIFSGSINNNTDRENAKRSIRELSGSGRTADFAGALREASARQNTSFSYTLLISASPESLSSVLEGPQANLLRFSRVEEFSTWRALVVALDIDTRVRRASAAFFGN
jgi:hypothetical protein